MVMLAFLPEPTAGLNIAVRPSGRRLNFISGKMNETEAEMSFDEGKIYDTMLRRCQPPREAFGYLNKGRRLVKRFNDCGWIPEVVYCFANAESSDMRRFE